MYSLASMTTAFSSVDSSFRDVSGASLTKLFLCCVWAHGIESEGMRLLFFVLRQGLHCVALAGLELM